jgi:hypothetical protein
MGEGNEEQKQPDSIESGKEAKHDGDNNMGETVRKLEEKLKTMEESSKHRFGFQRAFVLYGFGLTAVATGYSVYMQTRPVGEKEVEGWILIAIGVLFGGLAWRILLKNWQRG